MKSETHWKVVKCPSCGWEYTVNVDENGFAEEWEACPNCDLNYRFSGWVEEMKEHQYIVTELDNGDVEFKLEYKNLTIHLLIRKETFV
jgi:hypothetical protein